MARGIQKYMFSGVSQCESIVGDNCFVVERTIPTYTECIRKEYGNGLHERTYVYRDEELDSALDFIEGLLDETEDAEIIIKSIHSESVYQRRNKKQMEESQMTEELKKNWQILAEVQAELKAPKGQYNSFGKYKYRSCEDILEAVKPILAKHDATIMLSDEVVQMGDRYYITATATFFSGAMPITATAYAREPMDKKGMDDSQISGTASSYARKYALNGLLLIDDTKDADTDEYHAQTTAKSRQKQPIVNNSEKISTEQPTANKTDFCEVCGKAVDPKIAQLSIKKYGAVLCGEKCRDEYLKTEALKVGGVKTNA